MDANLKRERVRFAKLDDESQSYNDWWDPGRSARTWVMVYQNDIEREIASRGRRLTLMFSATAINDSGLADAIASLLRVPAHRDLEMYLEFLELNGW